MLDPLSHQLKPTKNHVLSLIKSFNSWAFGIKTASSPHKALQLYCKMHRQDVHFDSFSILHTLRACSSFRNLPIIRHLHAHITKLGFSDHIYVGTSLLNAYVVTSLADACALFDEMPERNIVTWNTMITGYSNSGDLSKAYAIFEEMPARDVSTWSAMISAYCNRGKENEGLTLFREMLTNEGLKPDPMTVVSVLCGCAQMGSPGLLAGKSVHTYTVKNGWELDVKIGTVLVNMYAKCGYLKIASRVFEMMQDRNVITWTALICGSAQHGYGKEALSIFEMMQNASINPNEMTFTGILTACAHTGLVDDGRKYFKMIKEYGLEPTIHHYGCMVDLFGRAGLLEEAHDVIRKMKFEPNINIWGSFLSACKEHKQFVMAERVIEQVLKVIRPETDGGVYSLIADLFVLNERWDDAERVRRLMLNQNVKKVRGSSFI
ncbi:pentatricopeptide repeat-containing protein [Tripterygium wilfordii]|uniref:Pentatricopeptide repeat-containing protein n=1 Tax=Tripterygium wilfordii TaxID=458696 RepID=A0A7J7C556_TRIWF|nr:pentatricopeptide repeat-containing protein At5g66520-like [Tripterygium wilfordii]KAF5729242.1 pentatricopeptide repeat-containing protein [Tripterygium wilfordii]